MNETGMIDFLFQYVKYSETPRKKKDFSDSVATSLHRRDGAYLLKHLSTVSVFAVVLLKIHVVPC